MVGKQALGVLGSALDGAFRLRAARMVGRAAWRAHVLVPTRADVLVDSALRAAKTYSVRGHHRDAAAVLAVAEARAGSTEARVQLAAARALAQLDGGAVPPDLEDVLEASLREADRHLDSGEITATAARLTDALALAYHPARHFGTEPSPMLDDLGGFLGRFEASPAASALLDDPAPRPRPERRRRTERLLVLAYDNVDFINPIAAEYRAADVEVRVLDLAVEPGLAGAVTLRSLVDARLRYGLNGTRLSIPEPLADDFAWADTIFVEWGHRALVWVSLLRGVEAPVVTRIHRYEALTAMPRLTVWGAIERAVFVAPAIRDLVLESTPSLAASRTEVRVVPNRIELAPFDVPKTEDAAFTLGLIGWNKLVKDPQWALEVLSELRRDDDRWRMVLVGEVTPSDSLDSLDEYHEDLTRRVVKLKDAVEVTGFTRDVPHVLARIGTILSSSRFEGTHEAFLQGAASGALPVVRDWPALRPWGGAASIYPAAWVVQSPQEAALRILGAEPDPPGSDDAREARAWATKHMDWSQVRADFDAAVLEP